jgi:hypothetical protein
MSQKKHKKIRRGFMSNHQSRNSVQVDDLKLLTRDQLLTCLYILYMRHCVQTSDIAVDSIYNQLRSKFGNQLNLDQLEKDLIDFEPLYHYRTKYPAVAVSVFHDEKNGTAHYSILTKEYYLEKVSDPGDYGYKGNGSKQGSSNSQRQSRTYCGCTPFNTFKLPLHKLELLQECLPYNNPTLDELIRLGEMDEDFAPLSETEMSRLLEPLIRSNTIDKFYMVTDTGVVTRVYGSSLFEDDYYQPCKTRDAWSRNVLSVPFRSYSKRDGRSLIRIPAYCSRSFIGNNL